MRKRTAYGFMLGITLATVGAMLWVPGESARPVRARQAEARRMEERVDGGGVMGRQGEHTVSSLSGGAVAEVFVAPGQKVAEGQALFRLDSAAQAQALAALLQADGRARARLGEVGDKAGSLGAETVWQDEAQWLEGAQAEQYAQQAALLEAQIAAQTVRAQAAGEVLATFVREGEVLLPGAPALTLAGEAQVVRMQVGERESLRLAAGLPARFLRDDVLLGEGRVLSVGMPLPRADGVLSATVELQPGAPIALPAGARLDVEIVCRAQEQAVLVPLEAMAEGEAAVWRVFERRAWRVPVQAGLQDALTVAVRGLPEDALVILDPPEDLREGQLVEVTGS